MKNPAMQRTSRIVSAPTRPRLSRKVPSTTIPKILTTSATPTIMDTKLKPVRTRLAETRHDSVKTEHPKGNAPKPIRMMVTARAVFRDMPTVAADWTGCVMYLEAISAKMIVGGTRMSRLNQGGNLQNVFILSLLFERLILDLPKRRMLRCLLSALTTGPIGELETP